MEIQNRAKKDWFASRKWGMFHHFLKFIVVTVNVIKRKHAVAQRFRTHTVADDVAGKNGAARAHKGNFHTIISLKIRYSYSISALLA